MKPFDTEIFYGERVGVLGANGAGKSHFLRLLAGEPILHSGAVQARRPRGAGLFAQTHTHPEWMDRTLVDLLWHGEPADPGLNGAARWRPEALRDQPAGRSDVQFAVGRTAGPVPDPADRAVRGDPAAPDEPTDNLDVISAEALEEALEAFEGTVLTVTHDRWFARSLDRFLIFGADGIVYESDEAVFDEAASPAEVRPGYECPMLIRLSRHWCRGCVPTARRRSCRIAPSAMRSGR